MAPGIDPDFNRLASLIWTHPAIERVRQTATQPVYLVGGAIRDGLADFQVDDIDLVLEGDPVPLARSLDPGVQVNDRFGTVNLDIDGHPVDIATARTETYARPGALPEVTPGSLRDDLIRRDFTINAMAIGIGEDSELIDPFGGIADLRSGVLRVLHERSFEDDPTRALRAARYAARFGFDLAPKTAELLLAANLGTISRERVENELRLIALEDNALEAFRLTRLWGLIDFEEGRLDLAERAVVLTETDLWRGEVPREAAILAGIFDDLDHLKALLPEPATPFEGWRLARGRDPVALVLARAEGAEWLDLWQRDWRWIELEITGADLLAAGIPEGPRVGVGLDAAREAKLNRGVSGIEAEMAVALEAARGSGLMNWREADGLAWLEATVGGRARVCFSSRLGGVSQGPFESLNLGILTEDRREDVLANRRLLAAAAGFDPDLVSMGRQVHGAGLEWAGPEVLGAYAKPGPEPPPEADGQLSAEAGRPLLVLVADCLPVALLGERGLGMLHCGWRGLAAGIVEAAAREIGADAAAIGPGIGPCCFEVGPEVEAAFAGLGSGLMNGRNLDLPEAARRLLAAEGVESVQSAGICTYCDRRFFSHRRDGGITGRQAGIAWLA